MNLTLVTHFVAAAIAALCVWVFQGARMDAAVADVRLEQSNERLRAVSTARANERAITKTYQEALNAARTRETVLRRDRDAARAESDGLREQAADAAHRIADLATPAPTIREYAATVNELLTDCSRSYQELAGKADGHAADVRTLTSAWPVIPNPRRPDGGNSVDLN